MNTVVKQENTYGIGDNFMISQIKIGKTTFFIASYCSKGETFSNVMENIIEHKIKAS